MINCSSSILPTALEQYLSSGSLVERAALQGAGGWEWGGTGDCRQADRNTAALQAPLQSTAVQVLHSSLDKYSNCAISHWLVGRDYIAAPRPRPRPAGPAPPARAGRRRPPGCAIASGSPCAWWGSRSCSTPQHAVPGPTYISIAADAQTPRSLVSA